MHDILQAIADYSLSRALLLLGAAMIFLSFPLTNTLIDHTGNVVETKLNSTENDNGVDGINYTYEDKKNDQYPYLTSDQVYYDVLNFNGDGHIQLISDTYVFDKEELNDFRAGDDTSDVYTKLTQFFDDLNDNDRFIKRIDGDITIYEKAY